MEGCPLLPIGNGHVTYDRPMHPDEAYVPFYTTINVVCTEGFALYQSQIFKCSSLGQWIPQQTKLEMLTFLFPSNVWLRKYFSLYIVHFFYFHAILVCNICFITKKIQVLQ